MLKSVTYKKLTVNIAALLLAAMFFSCENNMKEVQDFLADKNLPVAIAKNLNAIHTDSGSIKTRIISPLMRDFTNRKNHPYHEFPKGLKVTTYEKDGDSITLIADYARIYGKTKISEVKNNVIVINHKSKVKLYTEQLYWDQNTKYIYTEKKFKLLTEKGPLFGKGFESKEDLSKINMKNTSGEATLDENDEL